MPRLIEVDFIVYGPETFFAIEVKHNDTIHPNDLTGLQAFFKDYPECTPLLVYRGKIKLKIKDVLCIPAEEFLLQIDPEKPLQFF